MRQQRAWALVLGLATLGLAGCETSDLTIADNDYLNLPTGQRTARGDTLPGTLPPGGASGNGSTDSGSTGGESPIGETGTNPSSVSLAEALWIGALYPGSSPVNVAISQAPKGFLALAAATDVVSPLSVNWAIQGAYQAFGSAPALQSLGQTRLPSDRSAKEVELRERLATISRPAMSRFDAQHVPIRQLAQSPTYVKIDSTTPNVEVVVKHSESGITENGATRQKFVILVDKRDDATLFSDSYGKKLLVDLVKEIKEQIYPTNRQLFGNDPTAGEGQVKGLGIETDTTYFVISRSVNNDSNITDNGKGQETSTLGYFYLGDLLSDDPYNGGTAHSNRAKMLYLASSQVYEAKVGMSMNDLSDFNDLCGTIAHELQHLLFSWGRIQAIGLSGRFAENLSYADAWIDEGLAMVAMAANGYGPEGLKSGTQVALHDRAFLEEAPLYSLTNFYAKRPNQHPTPAGQWVENPNDAYGMAHLFAQYMVDQQGSDIIGKILASTKNLKADGAMEAANISPTGIVADALKQDGGNLAVLFGDFATALALDGTPTLAAGSTSFWKRYGISGVNIRSVRLGGPKASTSSPLAPRPFGVTYLKPDSLPTSSSALKLTGGSGLSTRLILHK